jgi:hypothetical protein
MRTEPENRSLMFRVNMRRLVYPVHPQDDPGLAVGGGGSELGAAIRGQLRSDAVRSGDRALTQRSDVQQRHQVPVL